MTKNEFLEKLRVALANDLTGSIIQENVDYYSAYISNEVKAGRDESEVVAELGDPWILARTVIDTSGAAAAGQNSACEQEGRPYGQRADDTEIRPAGAGIFRRLVILLGILGILIIIVAVIGGIISIVAPILVPLIVILVVIRSINRRW